MENKHRSEKGKTEGLCCFLGELLGGKNQGALGSPRSQPPSSISLPGAPAGGFLLTSLLPRPKQALSNRGQLEILSPEHRVCCSAAPHACLGSRRGRRPGLQEADGLVYCTFRNISTARLAGLLHHWVRQGHGTEARSLGLGGGSGGERMGRERRRKGDEGGKSTWFPARCTCEGQLPQPRVRFLPGVLISWETPGKGLPFSEHQDPWFYVVCHSSFTWLLWVPDLPWGMAVRLA